MGSEKLRENGFKSKKVGRGELETLGTEHFAEGFEQKSRAAAGGVEVEVVTACVCVDGHHQVERGHRCCGRKR